MRLIGIKKRIVDHLKKRGNAPMAFEQVMLVSPQTSPDALAKHVGQLIEAGIVEEIEARGAVYIQLRQDR